MSFGFLSPAIAAKTIDSREYMVDFYWRGCPVLERIASAIEDNSCGELRSLRFTWCRPKNKATSEREFLEHTLPAAIDGAFTLAGAEITALHIEKVFGINNLFALVQFANGVVAELELNEYLPLSMPDICFIKANFTEGHITNQPLVGHFNEEGSVFADDDNLQNLIYEGNGSNVCGSPIEQMQQRFRILAGQGKIAPGRQNADITMSWIKRAMKGNYERQTENLDGRNRESACSGIFARRGA